MALILPVFASVVCITNIQNTTEFIIWIITLGCREETWTIHQKYLSLKEATDYFVIKHLCWFLQEQFCCFVLRLFIPIFSILTVVPQSNEPWSFHMYLPWNLGFCCEPVLESSPNSFPQWSPKLFDVCPISMHLGGKNTKYKLNK